MRLIHWRVQVRRCSTSNESQALQQDPNDVTSLLGALKTCKSSRDVENARRFHSRALELECASNIRVACALVRMFSRCGSMPEARKVFDSMARKDINSWNELLAGYLENDHPELALSAFSSMMDSPPPDGRSFVSALKACSALAAREERDSRELKVNSLHKGAEIHKRASELGLEKNIFVSNTLIDMYAKCGDLLQAKRVFDGIPRPTLVSWNVLLIAYAENGQEELALSLLESMKRRKCPPDSRTFSAAAKACAKLAEKEPNPKSLRRAREIHSSAASSGCMENSDVFLTAALINMYSKAGSMPDAQKVFDESRIHDTATWNTLMLGYAENKQPEMALGMFDTMVNQQQTPSFSARCRMNRLTFYAALTACEHLEKDPLARVRMIHREAWKSGCESNMLVASTMVNLYAKLGSLEEAWGVFNRMESHDLVSRTSLMQACEDNGDPELALKIYSLMKQEHLRLDSGCLLAALKAAGKLASLEKCRGLHGDACRIGAEDDSFLVATLLDTYGRAGSSVVCQVLFDSVVKKRGRVVWTALISAFARSGGESHRVFEAFNRMVEDGFQPDAPALCCVISACAGAGLVERGKGVFSGMLSRFGVAPDLDHYHAMIDLLGRANRLPEAVELAEGMPVERSAGTWNTLLGACWKWRDVGVARFAFQRCVELDEEHQFDSSYVLMGNIYASLGMWREQAEVEKMRRNRASGVLREKSRC